MYYYFQKSNVIYSIEKVKIYFTNFSNRCISMMTVLLCVSFYIKDTVLFPVTSQLSDLQD